MIPWAATALFRLAKLAAICWWSPAPPLEALGLPPDAPVELSPEFPAGELGVLLLESVEVASETANGLAESPPRAYTKRGFVSMLIIQ